MLPKRGGSSPGSDAPDPISSRLVPSLSTLFFNSTTCHKDWRKSPSLSISTLMMQEESSPSHLRSGPFRTQTRSPTCTGARGSSSLLVDSTVSDINSKNYSSGIAD